LDKVVRAAGHFLGFHFSCEVAECIGVPGTRTDPIKKISPAWARKSGARHSRTLATGSATREVVFHELGASLAIART
jgi:hypothetical protein